MRCTNETLTTAARAITMLRKIPVDRSSCPAGPFSGPDRYVRSTTSVSAAKRTTQTTNAGSPLMFSFAFQ
jgi:hypothetical protein